MSVLIKGIPMPKESWECPCHDGETGRCNVTYNSCFPIPIDCPLVEVPTPHGRLIDADVIEKSMLKHLGISDKKYFLAQEKDFLKLIEQEETIIESEVDK